MKNLFQVRLFQIHLHDHRFHLHLRLLFIKETQIYNFRGSDL